MSEEKKSLEKKTEDPHRSPNRRQFLGLGTAAAVGGVTGFGSAYTFTRQNSATRASVDPPGSRRFKIRKKAILEKRDQQTPELVSQLKSQYEKPVLGKMRVWDLIEKLALCVDPTDDTLYCTSQLVHVHQVVAAMEKDRIADPDLYLVAFLHDLGKVLMLTGMSQENIVGKAKLIGIFENGVGLDQVTYQFGHPEIIYSRVKDHVPDHVSWMVRYHNIYIPNSKPYMNERDRSYAEKYLKIFQNYDTGFKSYTYAPEIDLKKYRDLIEQTFPNPISF